MKAKLSKSNVTDMISGYIEHIGGRGTPKCSINDPMHKTRAWVLGAGQRTPVLQIPKGHTLLSWVATKDYLRFVATRSMGSRGKADPLPSAPPIVKSKPLAPKGGGGIASMGDTMPTRTPKQMSDGVPFTHTATVADTEPVTVEPRRPDLSPKALLEGAPAERATESIAADEAELVDEVVSEAVPDSDPTSPASLLERLEALDYKSLKALADRYELDYTGRSAKAIINAILLYAESLPEDTQLEF